MKYFIAKRNYKIKCIFCNKIFLKWEKRVIDSIIYNELDGTHFVHYDYHYDCGIKNLSEKNKNKLINCKEKK